MVTGWESWELKMSDALNNAIQGGRSDQIVLVSEAFHENNLARIANQMVVSSTVRVSF